MRAHITSQLQVQGSNTSTYYLGAPVTTGSGSHDFLIEKFTKRLTAWKAKTLTQAGRLVLIKSTLASLPVYYMSTCKVPNSVIIELNRLMRNFFWGQEEGKRYMAYVAWANICRPIDDGGLGIRDLATVNDALLLKSLWAVASHGQALWIDIVKAKYLPQSLLWLSTRNYRCSTFWRSIMNLRDQLLPIIRWNLGNGADCLAYGQPWAGQGLTMKPASRSDSKLVVRDFLDEDGSNWDGDKLIQHFGFMAFLHISTQIQPPSDADRKDALVFMGSASGNFSINQMFNKLAN